MSLLVTPLLLLKSEIMYGIGMQHWVYLAHSCSKTAPTFTLPLLKHCCYPSLCNWLLLKLKLHTKYYTLDLTEPTAQKQTIKKQITSMVKVNEEFTPEQATKAQKGSRGILLLFL